MSEPRCPVEIAERDTDAGTKPLIRIPEPIDDRADEAYEREREREDAREEPK